jgi:hypothetical protein
MPNKVKLQFPGDVVCSVGGGGTGGTKVFTHAIDGIAAGKRAIHADQRQHSQNFPKHDYSYSEII